MNDDVPNRVSRTKSVVLCVIAAVVIIAFLGLTGTYTEIWDGGYPYVVCEFTFVDETGHPMEGVELQVERRSGPVRYHWPVDDFYPAASQRQMKPVFCDFTVADIHSVGRSTAIFMSSA